MTKEELIQERETYSYLANTLTQDHQQSVKNDLLRKVESLQYQIYHFDDKESVVIGNHDPNCVICHGRGYYLYGGSFGGPNMTQRCHCNLFNKQDNEQ